MRIKYKIMLAIITVGIGICLMTYQSYALWVANFSGGENIVNVGCFSIEFREDTNPISLNNTYPVSDAKGLTTTPYTFTITNTCTVDASYSVTLNTINTNTMTKNMIKYAIQKSTSPKPTSGINLGTNTNYNTAIEELNVTNLDESIIIETGTLKGKSSNEANDGESITYNLYLWMDEQTDNEGMNTTFEGSINIISSATEIPRDVADEIIASVDTTGKCPTVNDDGTVAVNSAEATDGYVCSAPDDYGTSYYFRGTVENNWVKFANSYWRIIRVNGDKSIRMIYAGDANGIDGLDNKEEVLKNGYNDASTGYTQIGESSFNSSSNDNAYVGYMYGTPGSATYEETHANTNNSTIKEAIDSWYETHLKGTEYESYLSDTLFCNDRSFNEINAGTGAGTSETYYRSRSGNKTLKCSQKNDRFTVDDEEIGNGALTYPISLITSAEVYLAGGYSSTNYSYYLYTGNYYWTLSPYSFGGSIARVRIVNAGGYFGSGYVNNSRGVRPVINLKAGSLKTGSGTALDPYQV